MEKRKTFKKIIEADSPEVEHGYVRTTRGELIPATKNSGQNWVEFDEEIIKKFFPDAKSGEYTFVHTHPHHYKRSRAGPALPSSPGDLTWFNSHGSRDKKGNLKGYFIVQRDYKTGEVEGVTYVAPATKREAELLRSPNSVINQMLEDANKFNMNLRFHPAEGYFFNIERGAYEFSKGYTLDEKTGMYHKNRLNELEGMVASILIGFAILFLLIRVPLTGNVISNSALNNYMGVWFIMAGLCFSSIIYFMIRKGLR